MAGLIENTKRAHFKITERGINTLKENPQEINLKYLKTLPRLCGMIRKLEKG